MENSKIEWCTHTFNPWIGCQEVSPGCTNCYAARQNRFRKWAADGVWGPHAERRRTVEGYWKQPFSWAKWARGSGTRPRVFCASLADVFDNATATPTYGSAPPARTRSATASAGRSSRAFRPLFASSVMSPQLRRSGRST
jgi:hypothetical protein